LNRPPDPPGPLAGLLFDAKILYTGLICRATTQTDKNRSASGLVVYFLEMNAAQVSAGVAVLATLRASTARRSPASGMSNLPHLNSTTSAPSFATAA
jgi:hypothetical protein